LYQVRKDHIPFCVQPHQSQLLPDPLDNLLNTEVELTTHDGCVRLAGQLVQELEADAVDLVVDVQASM
jgi:hypothetical protein